MQELLCPVMKKCGGCQLLALPYPEQLALKQRRVEALLSSFCPVAPIVGMENPYHYRNKVHAALGVSGKGEVVSGVYAAGTHKIIPVEQCLIEDERADEVVAAVRYLMAQFRLPPYDEDTGRGVMRHVLVRTTHATGQVLVTLVIGRPDFPGRTAFVNALVQACPFITSVVVNLNSQKTSMILGRSSRTAYGKGYIEDVLCGRRFALSPASFYQINAVQTEKLYALAIQGAHLTGRETLLDAYCGVGTIGLAASARAGRVIGVELNPDAVRDAENNARRNGVSNARFYQGDAGRFMQAMAQRGEAADVVMLDPPRAGSDERFLRSLCRMGPKRVVYVSCMPETLARDLRFLTAHGYRALSAAPVDMFPHTEHVETVVLLAKGEIDSKKVRVEFSLENMDMAGFQKGATYPQIKEYVQEHSGLKVSSLYISQGKRKCGPNVGQNYSLSKKENAKQPQCPPEKEKAIMEALQHFGMI